MDKNILICFSEACLIHAEKKGIYRYNPINMYMYHKGTVYVLKLKGIMKILRRLLSNVWLGASPAYGNMADNTELSRSNTPVIQGKRS